MSLVAVSSSWKVSIFPHHPPFLTGGIWVLPWALRWLLQARLFDHCPLAHLSSPYWPTHPPHAWTIAVLVAWSSHAPVGLPPPLPGPGSPGGSSTSTVIASVLSEGSLPPSCLHEQLSPMGEAPSGPQDTLLRLQKDNFRLSSSHHLKIIWSIFYYVRNDNTSAQKYKL